MLETSVSPVTSYRLDGMPDERRRRRGRAISCVLRNPVPGEVIDISRDGLGIECTRPLQVFTRYPFTLGIGSSAKARKEGEVRWCRLTATGIAETGEPILVYRAGIAFVDSDSDKPQPS